MKPKRFPSHITCCAVLAMLVFGPLNAMAAPPAPLQLRGQPGKSYVIEASDDLQHWTVIKTTQADAAGRVLFTDSQTGDFPRRFYRGRLSAVNLLGAPHHSGRVLVKPKNSVTLADVSALNATLGVTRLRTFPRLGNLQVVRTPGTMTPSTLVQRYRQSGLVEYAELDYFVHTQLEPNDTHYQDGSLWGLHNAGQFGGTSDADIDAPEAWSTIATAPNVIVAVIDTGIRYTHEDLAPNMWTNPDEIPGNGVDDDGNGYVDDVFGANVIANNPPPDNGSYTNVGDPNDDFGHGTHVAGTIGAVGNNLVGVVGVCWRVRLMALKVFDSAGSGTISDAVEAIDYARAKGAHVINASWGANWFTSQALRDAIASARDSGIIFCAAAGNFSGNSDADPVYPASYDLDNIISVAASTRLDELAAFSNFGTTNVDLAAPGAEVGSCWNGSDSNYQTYDGTSTATPHVSGVAALLRAFYPNEDHRQIINRILAGVDVLPALAGKCGTGGRLNVQRALGTTTPSVPVVIVSATDAEADEAGNSGAFTITRSGSTAEALTVNYTLSGTASNGADYQSLSMAATIPLGSSSTIVTVTPIADSASEGSESVVLTLSANSAYTVGSLASATVTIADETASSDEPVLTLSEVDLIASETGPDVGVIRFHRTGDPSQEIQVNWTFSGTAVNSNDFAGLPTTYPFPQGLEADLTITPIDDSIVEGSETVIVTLVDGPGYTVGTPNTATITIADNDDGPPPPLPTVTVTASDPDAAEPSNTGTFTISRTGSTASAITVNYALNGSAQNGPDYENVSNTATIAAGSSFATVTVTPVDDTVIEGNETVVLTLSASSAYEVGSPSSATVTIEDNDEEPPPPLPTVTVTASDANASESGNTGTLTISRTGSTASSLTVNYSVNGSAANGTDYQTVSGSVTISSGSSSATITVTPIDDSAVEGDETVSLTLSASSAYTVGTPNTATITIADNDDGPPPPLPTVTATASDPDAAEPSNAGTFTISRTGSTSSSLTVNYTLNGSAQNGTDYQSLSGSVTIASGSSSANVTVTPIDDSVDENNETVILTLASSSAYEVGSPSSATVTIADNDQPPPLPTVTVTASDASAAEPSNTGTLTISRTGSTASSLTVNYSVNGSAANGTDYQTVSGPITISSGSSSATITVTPIDDSAVEGDETVSLTLSASSAYTVGSPSSATVTIADNDQPPPLPTVTVTASDANAAEPSNTGTFTVSRTGSTTASLTVNYSMNGSAQNGTDYQNLSGSVSIAAGTSSATITLAPINDTEVEGNETAVLTLSSSSAYTVGSPNNATVTIADNDQPPPLPTVTVTASDANAAEPSNTGTFTVSRTGSTAASLTVNYSMNGSAQNGTDYQNLSGSVSIAAGASSATITLTPINDTEAEGSETAVLTLSSSSAYTVGSPNSATVAIADNDQPPPPLVADFTATPLLGLVPLVVEFSDRSTGNPVSWNWNFGDGSTSTARNPTHIYLLPGDYTATLTVRNSAGNTSSKSVVIRVTLLSLPLADSAGSPE